MIDDFDFSLVFWHIWLCN